MDPFNSIMIMTIIYSYYSNSITTAMFTFSKKVM